MVIYIKADTHGPSKHSCNSQMVAPDKSQVSYAVVVRLILEARYWTITYALLTGCFKLQWLM